MSIFQSCWSKTPHFLFAGRASDWITCEWWYLMSCTYFKPLLYFIVIGLSSAFSVRFSRETVPRVKSWHGIDGLGLESWLLVGGGAVWWPCGECAAYTNCGEQLLPESAQFQVPTKCIIRRKICWMVPTMTFAPGVLGLFVNKPCTWAARKATMTVAPVINQCHWAPLGHSKLPLARQLGWMELHDSGGDANHCKSTWHLQMASPGALRWTPLVLAESGSSLVDGHMLSYASQKKDANLCWPLMVHKH